MRRRGMAQLRRRLAAHEHARTNTSSSVVYMSTPRCVTPGRNATSGCEWEKIHLFLFFCFLFSMSVTPFDAVPAFLPVRVTSGLLPAIALPSSHVERQGFFLLSLLSGNPARQLGFLNVIKFSNQLVSFTDKEYI